MSWSEGASHFFLWVCEGDSFSSCVWSGEWTIDFPCKLFFCPQYFVMNNSGKRERERLREKTELISFDILCKVRTKDQRMGAILRLQA